MYLNMSSGLADIVSFFNNYASSGDVDGGLVSAAVVFKIALWFIIFIGAVGMAVFIGRIGIDILLLVFRGTKVADSKLKDLGTGKDGAASSVGDYIKKNGLEIIAMIVLLTFLMSGWLFRLVAIALTGFGALGNKLLNLDISSSFSNTEISSYVNQIPSRRLPVLKSEYDQTLGDLRNEARRLYEFAADGKNKTDPAYQKSMSLYTNYLYRAQALSTTLSTNAGSLNMKKEYFAQHLSKKGEQVCNVSFVDDAVKQMYTTVKVKAVTCN